MPGSAQQRRDEAADVAVRLTLSHMLLPGPDQDDVPARVARGTCAVLGVTGTSAGGRLDR
ncbi:hypothetical protein ACIHIX_24675 [Streptomyces sp. NPDC051913]|uniref:hypothetical protein n=1 Tax=Streptomyces sp. NPDC051913 TaxID=3365676 RepID=UPI0037D38D7D